MARSPVVGGFTAVNASWRRIAGIEFQVIRAYHLVAAPDRSRPQMHLWLRRVSRHGERALWSAKVARGSTPLAEQRAGTAAEAVMAAMDTRAWTGEPAPEVTGPGVPAPLYPDGYAMSPAGWYAERASAHDGRWDSRTGVL